MYKDKSGFHGGREAGGRKASPLLAFSSSVLSQSESSELGGPCEEEQKGSDVRLSISWQIDSFRILHCGLCSCRFSGFTVSRFQLLRPFSKAPDS